MKSNLTIFAFVFVLFNILLSTTSFASTSDTLYNRAIYRNWTAEGNAYGENIGWLTFSPNSSSTVHVADDGLSGYLYGENIGWISLSCRNTTSCGTIDYGVLNDNEGNLSGFAWGENIGWIDFGSSIKPYQVKISATSTFSGSAYSESTGYINFTSSPITTSWTPRSTRPECDDGIDNNSNGLIDYPNDTTCSSLTDTTERSSARRSVPTPIITSSTPVIQTPIILPTSTTTTTIATTTASTTTTVVTVVPIITVPQIQPPTQTPKAPPTQTFARNLKLNNVGNDVKLLQIYLNKNGFVISKTGAGSKGKETTIYGEKTKQAVKRFQEYYKAEILTPSHLTYGTGIFGEATRNYINSHY